LQAEIYIAFGGNDSERDVTGAAGGRFSDHKSSASMPSLKAMNRRWLFGGDELQVLSLAFIPVRVIQGLLSLLGTNSGSCYSDDPYASAWLWCSLAYWTICVVLDSALVHFGGMGTPTDPRVTVPNIVRFKTMVLFPACAALACLGIYSATVACGENALVRALVPLVVLSQLGELFSSACCLYAFRGRRLDDPHLGSIGQRRRLGTEYLDKKWEKRCRFFCKCSGFFTCFLFGGNDSGNGNDFSMVARVLSDYFEDDGSLDIVPSDVVAGMVCLRHVQKSEERRYRESRTLSAEVRKNDRKTQEEVGRLQVQAFNDMDIEVGSGKADAEPTPRTQMFERQVTYWHRVANRKVLDHADASDRLVLDEAARFARHALAIYTWMLYIFMNPLSGVPKLCKVRCCTMKKGKGCGCCGGDGGSGNTNGDVCCDLHATALLAQANLDESELAYAHFGNSIVENPYCIIVDHRWKSVVLSIRGTLSLEDCITDALTESVELKSVGEKWGFDGDGEYAHTGILTSAEWIRADLEKHGTLRKLMKDDDAPYKDYMLRVTGHSLGAGCATFLGLMLRREYPDLRCLPYSPPGGLVTIKTAKAVSGFTTSFILNSDIVPRLRYDSVRGAKNLPERKSRRSERVAGEKELPERKSCRAKESTVAY